MVAFGGNMGDVRATFLSARECLGRTKGLRILDSSCIYRSPPWGCPLHTNHFSESFQMGQTKARCADKGGSLVKFRNESMARLEGFPSGKPPTGHLPALRSLAMEQPLPRERALHLTGGRLAEGRFACKGQPIGPSGQPDYLNAVVLLGADMDAEMLLQHLQDIEKQHGRIRTEEHWGPRTLDLDLIAYNDTVMQTKHLTLPHPHMHERMFVLQPLCDIRPNWRHPVRQQTVRELWESLLATGVPRLEERAAW